MEPVVLVCEGCGVRIKIRTSDPAKARGRDCPRCSTPLAAAVDRALGIGPGPGLDSGVRRASARRVMTGTLAVLVTIGSLASLAVREASPGATAPTKFADAGPPRLRPRSIPPTPPAEAEPAVVPKAEADGPVEPEVAPDLDPPEDPGSRDLEIPEARRRDPEGLFGPPPEALLRRGLPDIVPPAPAPTLAPSVRDEPRRILVRDGKGRAIVAREYGTLKGRMAVLLPDGQIGWPEGLVETDRPFVPASMDELRRALLDDPEFATFRVHQTGHYLVFYQSTEHFAQASADLLERLHDGLTATLKKQGLPVREPEFPLVAVVFATENDFRANRRIAPDVQAYYEILSNRIFFYEKSRRDQDSPEVSALRKPQTVAHEGTHQILHNVGIQPRLADWPLWLVEGLAEYCSPPKMTRKGTDWAGLGQANPIHMATIRDLEDPMPDQFRGGPREALAARDRRPSTVEYLVTQKDLTPTDYARAWALTHYLYTQRLDEFVAYIKRLGRMKPFEERSPEEQLATFREVFGGDLAQMDVKVGKYVRKLKQADALPYFAVIFEQQIGPTIRREAMVSQSPSVIRQWLESVAAPEGAQPRWRFIPHPTRKKAVEAAEAWVMEGR